jgi:general stress protein 26
MATAATTQDKKPARASSPAPAPKPAAAAKSVSKPSGNSGAAKTLKAKAAAKPATAKSASAKPAATKPAASKSAAAKPAAKTAKKATATKVAERATAPANRQSRDSSMTGKEHDDHVERIWELAKRIGIAMFVTWDGKEQRARPLAATVEKDEGAIYFLTDVNGEKDQQIAEFPHVSVSFADHKHSKFVALSGKASVSNDRAKIKELWNPFAKAWWDSPEDPAIRVIKVVPQDAELWDSPGRIVTTISMLAAAVTGRSPKIGENAKVVL